MLIKDLANGYYVLAIDFLHIDQFPPELVRVIPGPTSKSKFQEVGASNKPSDFSVSQHTVEKASKKKMN